MLLHRNDEGGGNKIWELLSAYWIIQAPVVFMATSRFVYAIGTYVLKGLAELQLSGVSYRQRI